MTSDDSIYLYKDRYIPLSSLEGLYEEGLIRPEDLIYIADHQYAYFFCYDLKTLEETYGKKRPFLRPLIPDGQSSSDNRQGETFRVYKLPDEPNLVYVDYPLFHVETVPDLDQITGAEVFREMNKLKKLLPLNNWTPASNNKFFRLNRKGDRTAICRLCNFTPFGPLLFFKHMFSHQHCLELSKCLVSRRDFIYWAEEITGTSVPKEEEIEEKEGRIPLLAEAEDNVPSGFLTGIQIGLIRDLFRDVDLNWIGPGSFFDRYLKSIKKPNYCYLCKTHIRKESIKVAKHLFSPDHLENLKTVKVAFSEYNYWFNALSVHVHWKKEMKIPSGSISMIFEERNSPPLPLIDYKVESELLGLQHRNEKLHALRQLWEMVPKDEFNKIPFKAFDNNTNVVCFACEDLPSGSLLSRVDLIEHIFTEQHLRFLQQFGFSEKAWMAVRNLLQKCLDEVESTKKTDKTETSDKPEIPKQSTPVKESTPVQQKTRVGNDPRVPLLDTVPPNIATTAQKHFVNSLKQIERQIKEGGRELANKLSEKTGNWRCGYCPESITKGFNTELEIIKHILLQKHKEKMKFQSSAADLAYWTDRLNQLTKSIAPTHSQRSESKSRTPEPTPAKFTVSQYRPSKTFGNSPRIPMLDVIPPGYATVTYEYAKEKLNWFNELTNGSVFAANTKSIKVQWNCALCAASGYPTPLRNKHEAIRHIVSRDHRSIIKSTAAEDLKYWELWINVNKRKPPVVSNASDVGKVVVDMPERLPVPPRIAINSPRVPFLDPPLPGHSKVPKDVVGKKFNNFNNISNWSQFPAITTPMLVHWKCSFCPGMTPLVFNNKYEAIRHIVSRSHRKQMESIATEDLEYWVKWFEELDPRLKANKPQLPAPLPTLQDSSATSAPDSSSKPIEAKPDAPVPTDPLQRPSSPFPEPPEPIRQVPQTCTLPLFASQPTPGIEVSGPTVRQLKIFEVKCTNAETRSEVLFKHPTTCSSCRMEMTGWTVGKVVIHAFSVRHLKKSYAAGMRICERDFDYWLGLLKMRSPMEITDTLENKVFVNLKYRKPVPELFSDIFIGFTPEESKLLANYDINKLDQSVRNTLVQEYGACIECNAWIHRSSEIIPHYTHNRHFEKVRASGKTIRRRDVDVFLKHAKNASKASCILM